MQVFSFKPGLPKCLVFRLEPLVFLPKGVVTDPAGLFACDRLHYAVGMHVEGGATIAALVRPPRHRAPSPTEDGGGIANPGLNGYIPHGSEPPDPSLLGLGALIR